MARGFQSDSALASKCLRHLSKVIVFSAFLMASSIELQAQGTVTVLQTGGGQPLLSYQQVLQVGASGDPEILFDFGFATGETPAPGGFLDSFTVTIQDASSNTAVVATIDASGVVWAPPTPGNVFLVDNQIQRQAITPPSLSPILGQGVAFSVQLPLPTTFTGSSVTVYFDLFDNLNQTMSLGWFNNLQLVSVPEPPVGLMAGLGVVMIAIARLVRR